MVFLFILQVMLGRPLRISFALDKVRGAPVVVPRLSTVSLTIDMFITFLE
jgi:hypothetical protein